MKIVYLIESDAKCGGLRSTYEHVNRLIERGHEVKVLSLQGKQPDWFHLHCKITPFSGEIPKAEVLVSTSPQTAKLICSHNYGIPFHYQLSYDPILRVIWERDIISKKMCEEVYHMPVNILCNSNWLRNLFKKRFRRESHVIYNAIDHSIFRPRERSHSSRKRILMMYHIQPTKGIINGLSAFKLIKEKIQKVELIMFGLFPRPYIEEFPFFYHFNPSEEKLAELYSSCDVFIFPSIIEGFPKPPLEAMACKTAVVVTDCLGIEEFAENNKTAIVVPPEEPFALADAVIRLLENEDLRKSIASEGYKRSQDFRYEKVVDSLEKIFEKAAHAYLSKKEWLKWEKVLVVNEKDAWAHYRLGIELKEKGQLERAETEFDKAIMLDPDLVLAYIELEEILTTPSKCRNLKKVWRLLKQQSSS